MFDTMNCTLYVALGGFGAKQIEGLDVIVFINLSVCLSVLKWMVLMQKSACKRWYSKVWIGTKSAASFDEGDKKHIT